jgi:hypothetical protein
LAGLTLVPLGVALHLGLYRLDATDNGIVSRTPLGTTALAWRELERVEQEPDLIVLAGPGDDRIHIDTTDFEPEQRASLERAIARRVRESGGRFQESQPPGVSTDRQAAPQLGR